MIRGFQVRQPQGYPGRGSGVSKFIWKIHTNPDQGKTMVQVAKMAQRDGGGWVQLALLSIIPSGIVRFVNGFGCAMKK
jgi:hypothetical protein